MNYEAGIDVDTARFERIARAGDLEARGDLTSAIGYYEAAIELYRGDLAVGNSELAIIERERLRARYLTLLARSSRYYYEHCDYETCLMFALRLLAHDPCHEEAHRLVMMSHVRRGERSQAMRQFRLCEEILRREFDARPDMATRALFEKVRLSPEEI